MPVQLTIALLLLTYAALGITAWNLFFKPRLRWGWAGVLLVLALAPHLDSLRPGFVYGPLDTNHANLPWAGDVEALHYRSRGGALNDVTLQFAPWQEEARRQLLAGRLPLLNPYSACGQPLLANGQAAPFALTSLLSLPVDSVRAQVVRSFVKILLALVGTFLATRELGSKPVFCLLSAVAYGYGGSLAVWRLFPHAEVMAIWPFAYLATEQMLTTPSALRPRILLFLSLAGMFLAGHPETAAMAGLALLGRWMLALGPERKQQRAAAWCLGIALGALLATSFFALPLAESILGSEKLNAQGHGRDLVHQDAEQGGAWASLVNDVAPGIFGTPQGSSEHGPVQLHWMAEGSVGLVSLALALVGMARWLRDESHERERYLIVIGLLCFGVFFNVFGLAGRLFALPWVSAIGRRYTAYLGGFAVALLAARALDDWCTAPPERTKRRILALCAGLAFVAACAVRAVATTFWSSQGLLPTLPAEVLHEADKQWLLALLAALGVGACFVLRARATGLAALLVLLTTLQLWSGYGRYTPTVPSVEAMPRLAIVEAIRKQAAPFRVIGTRGVFFPNSSTYYRLADVRTHDPTEQARYVDWLGEFLTLDRSTYKKQFRRPQAQHEPFLRLLGVKYLLSGPDLRLGPPWIDRGLFGLTRLWELGGPVRWGFFPARVISLPDAWAARRYLNGQDVSLMATLEKSQISRGLQPNGKAQVLRAEVDGDRLALRVAVEANAWLVVAQAAIPGWRATADGKRVPVTIADGTLLAVYVPAGSHAVSLRFLPGSFVVGAILSTAACGSLSICLWAARRQRAKRGGAPTPPTSES